MAEQRIILHRFVSLPVTDEEGMNGALQKAIDDASQVVYRESEGRAVIEDIDVRPFVFVRQIVCLVKLSFVERVEPMAVDFDTLERFEPNNLNLALGEGAIDDYHLEWYDGRMWADALLPDGQTMKLISDKEGKWYVFPEEKAQDV